MNTEFIDSLKSSKSLPFSLSCNLLCPEILCRTQNGTKSFLITHSWVKGVCRVVFRICVCDAAEELSFSRARPRKCVDLWVRSSWWWTETEQSLAHTGERVTPRTCAACAAAVTNGAPGTLSTAQTDKSIRNSRSCISGHHFNWMFFEFAAFTTVLLLKPRPTAQGFSTLKTVLGSTISPLFQPPSPCWLCNKRKTPS